MSLKLVGTGDIQKDFDDFFEVLVEKFNIKDKEKFRQDLYSFISQNVKEGYEDPNVFNENVLLKVGELDRMVKDFFDLVNKNAADFDFYEGAKTEAKEIREMLKERKDAQSNKHFK